jgi:hypothetical protein
MLLVAINLQNSGKGEYTSLAQVYPQGNRTSPLRKAKKE